MTLRFRSFLTSGALLAAASGFAAFAETAIPEPALAPQPVITLPGMPGGFDFMATDAEAHRILAAHKGARTLEILDLDAGKPLAAVTVGAAQGVAVDTRGRRYFTGNEADKSVSAVDAKTLKKTSEVKVSGPVDAIAFDSKRNRVYAAEDEGDRVWVIDAKAMKVIGEVKIPGVPEVLEYDPVTDRLYLNIKDKDELVRIDPATNRVDATWPTSPAKSPHGLAIDSERGRIFSAGGNGKLVELDIKTGKIIATADIAPGVDQIAYDPGTKRIYGAGRQLLSVTKAESDTLVALPSVASPRGAHTLAIDPNRHDVWVSFADKKNSFFASFKTSEK